MRKNPPATLRVRLAKLWLRFLIIVISTTTIICLTLWWQETLFVLFIVGIAFAGAGAIIATIASLEVIADSKRRER